MCKKNLVQNTHREEYSGKASSHWHLSEYIFFHSPPSKLVVDAIFSSGLSSVLLGKWSFLFLNTQQKPPLITVNGHRLFLTLSSTLDYLNWDVGERELVIFQYRGFSANDVITLVIKETRSTSSLSLFIIWSIICHTTVGKTHGRLYWFDPDKIIVQPHLFKNYQW